MDHFGINPADEMATSQMVTVEIRRSSHLEWISFSGLLRNRVESFDQRLGMPLAWSEAAATAIAIAFTLYDY
jgi:hypothetical protein